MICRRHRTSLERSSRSGCSLKDDNLAVFYSMFLCFCLVKTYSTLACSSHQLVWMAVSSLRRQASLLAHSCVASASAAVSSLRQEPNSWPSSTVASCGAPGVHEENASTRDRCDRENRAMKRVGKQAPAWPRMETVSVGSQFKGHSSQIKPGWLS